MKTSTVLAATAIVTLNMASRWYNDSLEFRTEARKELIEFGIEAGGLIIGTAIWIVQRLIAADWYTYSSEFDTVQEVMIDGYPEEVYEIETMQTEVKIETTWDAEREANYQRLCERYNSQPIEQQVPATDFRTLTKNGKPYSVVDFNRVRQALAELPTK